MNEILENAERIASYIASLNRAKFLGDDLRRDAVERCIERISEAAKKLGAVAEERMPDQPSHEIRAVGNVLRHMYDDVDPDIVWRIAAEDIPKLAASLRKVLTTT